MGDHAKQMRRNLRMNSLKKSGDRFVRVLEAEEEAILGKYLGKVGM